MVLLHFLRLEARLLSGHLASRALEAAESFLAVRPLLARRLQPVEWACRLSVLRPFLVPCPCRMQAAE